MYQPKSYYADSSIKLPDYRLFSVWDVKCDDKYKYDNSKSTINPQFSYMYSLIRGINGAGSLQIKGTQIDLNANSIVIVRYLDIEEYRSLSPVWHYV